MNDEVLPEPDDVKPVGRTMSTTTHTAAEVARQMNDWSFAGQSGVACYRRTADGHYTGGEMYTEGTRPPLGEHDRALHIRGRRSWTAHQVDAEWTVTLDANGEPEFCREDAR